MPRMYAEITLEPPFHDLDIMNIVWHGHYYKYFEIARCALMKALALDWTDVRELGFAMPIVETTAKYRRPLIYGVPFVVSAEITEFDLPALEVKYKITDPSRETEFASGMTRQAYFSIHQNRACYTIPETILARFSRHSEEPLP